MVLDKIAESLSTRAGSTVVPSQVLLKAASQIGVGVVVTTSSKEWRMKEQLASGAIPSLTEEELNEIKTVGATYYQRVYMKHMELP